MTSDNRTYMLSFWNGRKMDSRPAQKLGGTFRGYPIHSDARSIVVTLPDSAVNPDKDQFDYFLREIIGGLIWCGFDKGYWFVSFNYRKPPHLR